MAVLISEAVKQKIVADFERDYQSVTDLLTNECGDNLPFRQGLKYYGLIERVRLAVLELSRGDVDHLLRCIASAQQDWRDVLAAVEG